MRYSVILMLIFLGACTKPKPRKPVNKTQATNPKENYSIAFGKAITQHQEQKIKDYIKKDSVLNYQNSNFGFVFAKIKTNHKAIASVKKGSKVTYQKTIFNLQGKQIYPARIETNVIGKSNEIKGIIEGLKLMKQDEEFKFIFTSFVGYGMYGDDRQIGGNTPIIVNIKLLNINN